MHRLPDSPHGYHERSRVKFGLHLDSTKALSRSPLAQDYPRKSLKNGKLGVVARDGIEPPTPAFSGLASPTVIAFKTKDPSRFSVPKIPGFLGQ